MCAVRSGRSGATHVLPLARWVGRPRQCAPANDNRGRWAAVDAGEIALEIGWRLTMGVSGLGLTAAGACLLATAWPA